MWHAVWVFLKLLILSTKQSVGFIENGPKRENIHSASLRISFHIQSCYWLIAGYLISCTVFFQLFLFSMTCFSSLLLQFFLLSLKICHVFIWHIPCHRGKGSEYPDRFTVYCSVNTEKQMSIHTYGQRRITREPDPMHVFEHACLWTALTVKQQC